VKAHAQDAAIPVLQPDRARHPEALHSILALRPDVLVVASYGEILPVELIEAPPFRSLNLHPSLLPSHRGPSPVESAILQGDTTTGATLMLMTAKMDAGPILDQAPLAIHEDDTGETLERRLAVLSADLLLRDLPAWVGGAISPRPQAEEEATYTRRITKDDGRIDWSLPSSQIARQVRAFYPWPVAYTYWGDRMLRVLRASVRAGEAPPGKVIRSPDGAVAVGTGAGLLLPERVQIAGGRETDIAAFVLGHRDVVGSTLE
jgi:methionyl-tRNA formyltransferase